METFIIDWPVLALLGLAFGSFAPSERWWRSRAFVAGTASAIAFTATAMISYVLAPDWMWMYFLEREDASWAVPFIPVGFLFVYVMSFAAATALKGLGRGVVWIAAGLAVAAEVIVLSLTWDRYHRVGTTAEWLRDSAHELFTTSPTGPVKTISVLGPVFVVVTAAAFVVVIRSARADSSNR
jgi:hypothetical protein